VAGMKFERIFKANQRKRARAAVSLANPKMRVDGNPRRYDFLKKRLDYVYVYVIRSIHYIDSLRWTARSLMRIVLRTPSRTYGSLVGAISLDTN